MCCTKIVKQAACLVRILVRKYKGVKSLKTNIMCYMKKCKKSNCVLKTIVFLQNSTRDLASLRFSKISDFAVC